MGLDTGWRKRHVSVKPLDGGVRPPLLYFWVFLVALPSLLDVMERGWSLQVVFLELKAGEVDSTNTSS